MIRAVFLDRDKTLIAPVGGRPANKASEVHLLPDVSAGISRLMLMDLKPVVVTNQGGIELGYCAIDDVVEAHERMTTMLGMCAESVPLYVCPHYKVSCECRKPKPGMILKAAAELNIDLARSYLIGDDAADIVAGHSAGVGTTVLIGTDNSVGSQLASYRRLTFYEAAKAIQWLEAYRR
jgi:D-glycero-D-manno-heptose 1,7-bisphosphate phosphatase